MASDLSIDGAELDDVAAASDLQSAAERGGIQSIDRAANVLALFDQHTRSLTPGLVSERLGLNRTTAHRYLQSLQGSGFLSASYGPGPLLDQLSAFVSVRQQLITLAPTVMRRLSDRTGLTAVLSFLGRSGAVVALVEEANEGTIVLTIRIGTVLEVKAAQSRALLAFQADPGVVARIHSTLDKADARSEEAELAKVRRDKVAWADLQRTGLASAAVPVFGSEDVQAAMALIGTSAMLSPDDPPSERVTMLQDAAETLSGLVVA